MKKLIMLILVFSFINVYADKCSYDEKVELSKLANAIKINYEEKFKEIDGTGDWYGKKIKEYYLDINIYNLSDKLLINITNDANGESIVVSPNDIKDGKYTFTDYDYYKVIKYNLEIWSNTDCDSYLIKNKKYTKPMYNSNNSYLICQENESIPLCQRFTTNSKVVKNMGIGLPEAIENFKKTNDTIIDDEENEKGWFSKYWKYFLIVPVVALAVGGGVYIYKKRSEI